MNRNAFALGIDHASENELRVAFSDDISYIKEEIQQSEKAFSSVMEHARNVGERLLEIKAKCPHRHFNAITANLLGLTSQKRSVYMSIHKNWEQLKEHQLTALSPEYALRMLSAAVSKSENAQHVGNFQDDNSGDSPRNKTKKIVGLNQRYSNRAASSQPDEAEVADQQPDFIDVKAEVIAEESQPEITSLPVSPAAGPNQTSALRLPAASVTIEPPTIEVAPQSDDRDEQITQLQQQLAETQDKLSRAEARIKRIQTKFGEHRERFESLLSQAEQLADDYNQQADQLSALKEEGGFDQLAALLEKALTRVEELEAEKAASEVDAPLKSYWEQLLEQPINAEPSEAKELPQTDIKLYAWTIQLLTELLEPPSIVASYLDQVDSLLNKAIELSSARLEEFTCRAYQRLEKRWREDSKYKAASSTYGLDIQEFERLRIQYFFADYEMRDLKWQLKSEKEYSQQLLKSTETFYKNRLAENRQRLAFEEYKKVLNAYANVKNPTYVSGAPAPEAPATCIDTLRRLGHKYLAPAC